MKQETTGLHRAAYGNVRDVGSPSNLMAAQIPEVPDGWRAIELGEIASRRKGTVDPKEAPGLRYVGLEHMDSGQPRLSRWGLGEDVRSAKSSFRPGDILYGKLRPYLDKAVLAEWEGICSTDVLVVVPDEGVFAPFLVFAVHTKSFHDHAVATTTGVNHPRTSWKALSRYVLPLPPVPEQRVITRLLRTVQEAIEATERVITAAKELKKSLMRYLFTYGPVPIDQADQIELKETEIGPVPEGWETMEFGNLATLQRGKDLPKAKRETGTVPVIGSNGIVGYHSVAVAKGPGVLVGRSGSVGKVTWCESDFWPLNTTLWVKDMHGNVPLYIFYRLSWFDFGRYVSGVSVPTLNRNLVHPVQLGVPPVPEQERIANLLASVGYKIRIEEDRKTALETLFKTLLHHLMTGKVRVKELHLEQGG